jgi:hypothetical protein
VSFEPEGAAAVADLREVGALAAVADERRVLQAELFDGFGGAPEEDVGGVGANVLGVAVDAAFRDVDLAAALDLGERSGGWGEGLLGGPGSGCGEDDGGGGDQLAATGLEEKEELRHEDDDAGEQDEECRDVAEVLAHADAHGGAEPAADGIDPASSAAAVFYGRGGREERGVGYEGDGVEGDADGIEERGEEGSVGIEEEEAGAGEGEEGEGEGGGEAATAQEPGRGEGGGEMEDAVDAEVDGSLPGAGLEGGGALDDEEGSGVQPD